MNRTKAIITLAATLMSTAAISAPASAEIFGEIGINDTVLTYFRQDNFTSIPGNSTGTLSLVCPAGFNRRIISGGFDSQSIFGDGFSIQDSYPISNNAWFLRLRNKSSSAQSVRGYIVCGS
jgi:hypothetical protein